MNQSDNNLAPKERPQKKAKSPVIKDKKLALAALRLWEAKHRDYN